MAKKMTAAGDQRIYLLAYLHDEVNRYAGLLPPGLDELARQLDQMNGDGFQFFRASPEWYVVVRSTLHEPTPAEPRGYVANLALAFGRAHGEELMKNPATLSVLKKVMGELPHEKLAALDETPQWMVWPDQILDVAPVKRQPPTPLVRDLLRVTIADLLGESCYTLVEGRDEDILEMLNLLPLKFRMAVSFSSPYAGGRICQVNNVADVRRKLNGAPVSQRYLINRANAGSVRVSPRAEELVNSLLSLPAEVLDRMDSLAGDEKELIKLLELYQSMCRAVKGCERREVSRLNQGYPQQVAALLPLMDQDSAAKWKELSQPRQSGGGRRSLEREEKRPSRLEGTAPIAVAGILVLSLLAYLLIGTGVVSGGDGIYFTIQFTGNGLIKLLLGVIVGFCGGYLCFRRK